MATKRLTMRKIQELLRLHYELKLKNREIASSLKISAGTVSVYLRRATLAGISWPLAPELQSEDILYARLFPKPEIKPDKARPIPDWHQVHQELKRHKGVTLLLLWHEYRERHPDGYGYSYFCESYNNYYKTLNPSMRQTHIHGDKMFVDYAGVTVPWFDRETGVEYHAEIFVSVLGASSYTYVRASRSQGLQDWCKSHEYAFLFFGGVTNSVVPDNLRAAVSKAHRYEPDLNPTYQELAEHYGVAIIPARVRKPKDKAKVEVGVQGIERWILAPLRKRRFFSIAEINAAIEPLLKAYNERPFQQMLGSRLSHFQEHEKPALKPLPANVYDYAEWKKAKSGIDYHVAVDKHYYSIPYQYVRKAIDVRISSHLIECFYKSERMAVHARVYKAGHSTIKAHMPKSHQAYLEWTPERLRQWARKTGKHTEALIAKVIADRPIAEQSFRACLGILRLGKHYGDERLENAAKRALALSAYRYRNIESILKNGLDKQPLPQTTAEETEVCHDNVRGSSYYH